MTGRVANWDVGFINMQTAESDNFASENFGVLRLQRKTFNDLSNVGSMFTSRLAADGAYNYVYGFDSETNLVGDLFLEVMGSQTLDSELPSSIRSDLATTTAFRTAITLQKSIGFNYRFVVSRTGEDFDPGIGFVRRTGTTDSFARLAYGWFAPENSIINRQNIDMAIFTQNENDSYDFLNQSIWSGYSIRFKQIGQFELDVRYNREILLDDEDFDLLGRIYVPGGEFETTEVSAEYQTNEGRKLQFVFSGEYGGLYDGTSYGFGFDPRWIVNSNLEIGGSYSLTHLEFPELTNRTKNDYTAHLGQFRAQYALNKQFSASTFVQYSNVSELVGANLRFRYNFSEGRDFWLVFNEQVNTVRDELEVPRVPRLQNQTILLKYTHTFIF
jgi:aromatic ring-cleaving dioxygenase